MNKSAKIREYITAHPRCDASAVSGATGIDLKFVQTICAQRVKAGEFVATTDGLHSVRPGYVAHARRKPAPKKRRVLAGERRAKKAKPAKQRTLRDVKVPKAKGNGPLREAVLANYRQASAALRTAIVAGVTGYNEEPILKLALDAHARAEALLEAAA
ncbi:MAG TPA: hypothetical protein VJ797_15725 [Burkholderiales bacterium]|nr:hypothetical protein [Burkholderiales bacterium]